MVGSRSLEKAEPARNIAPVSNRLQFKYLVRGVWCVVAAAAVGCGHKPETSERPQPSRDRHGPRPDGDRDPARPQPDDGARPAAQPTAHPGRAGPRERLRARSGGADLQADGRTVGRSDRGLRWPRRCHGGAGRGTCGRAARTCWLAHRGDGGGRRSLERPDARREGADPWAAVTTAQRAARLARWVALGSGLGFAGYLALMLRSVPAAWLGTGRTMGALAVVAWCLLTYKIVKRVALEWLK